MKNVESNRNVAISALRGLATAGYFDQEQLTNMESILSGKSIASQPHRWLTIDEACKYAKVSRSTLWRFNHLGQLNVYKFGGKRLIDEEEIDRLILSGALDSGSQDK